MRCPVCKTNIDENIITCPECGFNQLHREFLNKEELNQWIKETVAPCEEVAEHLLKTINVLLNRENELLKNTIMLLMRMAAMRIIYNAEIKGRSREISGFIYNGELWVCDGFRIVHFNSYFETFPYVEETDEDNAVLKHFNYMVAEVLNKDEKLNAQVDNMRLIAPSRHQLKKLIMAGKETYSFGEGKPLVNIHFLLDMIEALPDATLVYENNAPMIYFSSEMGEGILLGIKPNNDKKGD